MTTYGELRGQAVVWPGVANRSLMVGSQVEAGCYLADMAAKGNWHRVMHDLDPENHLLDVNQWRPGDGSWITVLHEAAKQGAPLDVVSWLINRGALRSQKDAEGRTPYELAKVQGHGADLLDLLAPPPPPLSTEQIDRLDSLLAEAIDHFIQPTFEGQDLRRLFRYPPVGVLHELPARELWLQLPPILGGLRVTLQRGYLDLLAGYRSPTPAGGIEVRTWGFVITGRGVSTVYEGFVNTPADSEVSATTAEDTSPVLKWRQVSDWWQATLVDPATGQLVTSATSFRIYQTEDGYQLWAWPQADEDSLALARRLSLHTDLDHAKQAANAHVGRTDAGKCG